MDSNELEQSQAGWLDRFRKSWFPPAAVLGALAAFAAAAVRTRPDPRVAPRPTEPSARPAAPERLPEAAPASYARNYARTTVLGDESSGHPFLLSLGGIAVGGDDAICALGDGEIRVFESGGAWLRSWKTTPKAACVAVGPDGLVCVGSPGRVDLYDPDGRSAGGFPVGDGSRPAGITAVKPFREEILVADADMRLLRRYDRKGTPRGLIGNRNKTGSFILPNGWLDFDVDSQGNVWATDTGRHLVTSWALDGAPVSSFGRFGMSDPADFVGCCNPVNVALAPDGSIVTGEKMVARVKVYDRGGKLLSVIGPENFDANCIHIHLAVDSKGRILAGDPVRRRISVFSPLGTGKEAQPI